MDLSSNDRRLINALRIDARKTIGELSRELDLSCTAVQKRLAEMEESGIIAGYHLELGDAYQPRTFQAYVNLVVHPHLGSQVVGALEGMSELEALHTFSGKIDLVAIIRVNAPVELDSVLDRIGEMDGVRDKGSAIVLSTKFDRR